MPKDMDKYSLGKYRSSVYKTATIIVAGEPMDVIKSIAEPQSEAQETVLKDSQFWELLDATDTAG